VVVVAVAAAAVGTVAAVTAVAVAAVAAVAMAGHKQARPAATTTATSEGDPATRPTASDKHIHFANVWPEHPDVHFPSD